MLFTITALLPFSSIAQNVGIGNSTPAMKLHISSSSDTALLMLDNSNPLAVNTNSGIYFKNGNYFTGAIKAIGTGSVFARIGFFTFAASDQNILQERISITDDGNVGIGWNAPDVKLDINGEIKIRGGAPGAGKVLTSDATGLASWQTNAAMNSGFKAVIGGSGYNIDPSVNTTIIFTTEEYDDPSVYFPPTFVTPSTGLYHFDALLHWNITSVAFPTQYVMYLTVNGVQRHGNILDIPAGAGGFRPQALSADIKLTTGDTVEIVVIQTSGIIQSITGTFSGIRYSYFSGRRIY